MMWGCTIFTRPLFPVRRVEEGVLVQDYIYFHKPKDLDLWDNRPFLCTHDGWTLGMRLCQFRRINGAHKCGEELSRVRLLTAHSECMCVHILCHSSGVDKTGEAQGSFLATRTITSCCLLSKLWRGEPTAAGHWRTGCEIRHSQWCMDPGCKVQEVEEGKVWCACSTDQVKVELWVESMDNCLFW